MRRSRTIIPKPLSFKNSILKKLKKNRLFAIGIALNLYSLINYYLAGYGLKMLFIFCVSLILVAMHFYQNQKEKTPEKIFSKKDLLVILFLLIIFAPIYLIDIYNTPWQINSDEIGIMGAERIFTSKSNPDIFGLSGYFDFPSFSFLIYGWLAKFLGGINLLNARIIHSLFALLIISVSYLFFRTGFNTPIAFGAALVLGSQHALLAISRMAMRDNSALVAEILALFFLAYGWKIKNFACEFIGGIFLGLTFYVYTPSKITILIWMIFIIASLVFMRRRYLTQTMLKLSAVGLLGFLIMSAPGLIASAKAENSVFGYSRSQILIFKEGRQLEKEWTGAKDHISAVKKNISNGITSFNNKIHDQGYIYPNYGHGFTDPLTGGLIWFGLVFLLFKREKSWTDLLVIAGFLTTWLTLAFFITKSPNYTRLLIVLPFTSYLVAEALKKIPEISEKFPKYKIFTIAYQLFFFAIAFIAVLNFSMFWDFVNIGFAKGNDLGGTGRYIESKALMQDYDFYLVANSERPYFSWNEAAWESWIGFFTVKGQNTKILKPENFLEKTYEAPFTFFMNKNLWESKKNDLVKIYGNPSISNITPDGRLKAVEILK